MPETLGIVWSIRPVNHAPTMKNRQGVGFQDVQPSRNERGIRSRGSCTKRRRSSRLIASIMQRLWPKTLTLTPYGRKGASRPRSPGSATVHVRFAPICADLWDHWHQRRCIGPLARAAGRPSARAELTRPCSSTLRASVEDALKPGLAIDLSRTGLEGDRHCVDVSDAWPS